MNTYFHHVAAVLVWTLPWIAAPTTASAQGSPEDTVRKILDTIDEEMSEIDRLLENTQDRSETPSSSSESVDRFKKALKETEGSQARVVRGIDDLIEQLRAMQQQSSSGGQSGDQQNQKPSQRSSDRLEDQQSSERQESSGQQQSSKDLRDDAQKRNSAGQQPKDGETPRGGQPDPAGGANQPASAAPDGGTERVVRDRDRARWGNLQRYDIHKHIRGGLPEVPEKYRRFLEAYQRANQRTPSNNR